METGRSSPDEIGHACARSTDSTSGTLVYRIDKRRTCTEYLEVDFDTASHNMSRSRYGSVDYSKYYLRSASVLQQRGNDAGRYASDLGNERRRIIFGKMGATIDSPVNMISCARVLRT